MFKREEIRLALQQGILEMTLKDQSFVKGTLLHSHIPAIATEPVQQDRINKFYDDNPELIAYWDVVNHRWAMLEINKIVYMSESPTA